MNTPGNGPLVVAGEIVVDGEKFPALRRALERGQQLVGTKTKGWAYLAFLRQSGQHAAADKLVRDLLGVKSEPMSEETKAALRAKRAAMTDDEKRAEREERKANRVLKRLAARAAGRGMETTNTEDAMSKKKSAKSKAEKSESKAKKDRKPASPKERDPRIPPPGSTIHREYKGKMLEVKVLDQGFEFEGTTYPSLTALALKITGAKAISGPRFFNLDKFEPVEAKK